MHPKSLLLGVSTLIASSAHAIEVLGPRPTNFAADKHDLLGFSPAPTTVPSPHELRARLFQPRALTSKTCAYLDGSSAEPYTCGFGSACLWNTASLYFGCCSADSSGNFDPSDCPGVANPYTSCYPYVQATDCIGTCLDNNLVCGKTLPYCAAGYLTGAGAIYTQYFCNSLYEGATLNFLPTFTDAAGGGTTPVVTTTPIVTTTPVKNSTPVSVTTPTPNPDPYVPPTPPPKRRNTGAVAGGVVGGLAALAAIAGGTILALKKRKLKQRQQAQMEISQVGN